MENKSENELSLEAKLAAICERRARVNAPWNISVPTVEMGYTNGAILWDREECNVGEVAPADCDYQECDFEDGRYRNSNADFIAHAPEDIDTLRSTLNIERELRDSAEREVEELETALRGLMVAYERRIRSDCTPEQLKQQPWRVAEYVAAEEALYDETTAQSIALATHNVPAEK